MKELVKISQTDDLGQVVSARELFEFLKPPKEFEPWMDKMLEFGFEEDVDYFTFESGDYSLTIDTAKEISMVQCSERGKEARRYFINFGKIERAPLLANGIFTIQDGMVIANSRDIARVMDMPLKQVNQDIKRFVETFCDFIHVGRWPYSSQCKSVPKLKGGVLGKLVSV